jgi:hypothetical protein
MSETLITDTITPDQEEFMKYLQAEFKVSNPDALKLIAGLFSLSAIKSVRDLGLLDHWNPVEAARQRLMADGVANPQEQYPFLQRGEIV